MQVASALRRIRAGARTGTTSGEMRGTSPSTANPTETRRFAWHCHVDDVLILFSHGFDSRAGYGLGGIRLQHACVHASDGVVAQRGQRFRGYCACVQCERWPVLRWQLLAHHTVAHRTLFSIAACVSGRVFRTVLSGVQVHALKPDAGVGCVLWSHGLVSG